MSLGRSSVVDRHEKNAHEMLAATIASDHSSTPSGEVPAMGVMPPGSIMAATPPIPSTMPATVRAPTRSRARARRSTTHTGTLAAMSAAIPPGMCWRESGTIAPQMPMMPRPMTRVAINWRRVRRKERGPRVASTITTSGRAPTR